MQIIHPNGKERNNPPSGSLQRNQSLFLGGLLIVAGGLWLLKNFGVFTPRTFDLIFSWPTLLIVIGGYLLSMYQWVWGSILGGIGLCLLIAEISSIPIPLLKLLLPLLCIGIGISLLLRKTT